VYLSTLHFTYPLPAITQTHSNILAISELYLERFKGTNILGKSHRDGRFLRKSLFRAGPQASGYADRTAALKKISPCGNAQFGYIS
jgi:hypothetical protein